MVKLIYGQLERLNHQYYTSIERERGQYRYFQGRHVDPLTNKLLRVNVQVLIKCNFLYCIGLQVTLEALDEVASLSGVKSVGDDYLPKTVRESCERIIPNIDGVKPAEAADAYLFLKEKYKESSPSASS